MTWAGYVGYIEEMRKAYRISVGISLLPTTYKILYSILLRSVTPYVEKIIEDLDSSDTNWQKSESTLDRLKIKLFLGLTKHHAMKTYWGIEVI
jgi:hypothetical protein